MQNFVLAGKAGTVFRLIAIKAKREEKAQQTKKNRKK